MLAAGRPEDTAAGLDPPGLVGGAADPVGVRRHRVRDPVHRRARRHDEPLGHVSVGNLDCVRHALRSRPGGGRVPDRRSGVHLRAEEVLSHPAARDPHRLPGLPDGAGRTAHGPGPAVQYLAPDDLLAASLRDVRARLVRQLVQHGADRGVPAAPAREVPLASAAAARPLGHHSRSDRRVHPFHAAPVVAGRAVPDRAREDVAALLFAAAAAVLPHQRRGRRPGHDDRGIQPFRPGVPAEPGNADHPRARARDPAGHHSAADHPGHRHDSAGRVGLPAPAAISRRSPSCCTWPCS